MRDMSRPARLHELNNVECVGCGSVLTRCRGGGRTLDDERIRRRICDECGTDFTTVELPLFYDDGSTVPLTSLVPSYLWANRRTQRARIGYHATSAGQKPWGKPARIRATIRVSRPVRAAGPGPWEVPDGK